MKTISAQLLILIAAQNGMKCLIGDIHNAYLNTCNCLDIISTMGKEFLIRDSKIKPGQIVVVTGNLYGLVTGAMQRYAHLADSIRSFGFKPTRFDPDMDSKCWKREGVPLHKHTHR